MAWALLWTPQAPLRRPRNEDFALKKAFLPLILSSSSSPSPFRCLSSLGVEIAQELRAFHEQIVRRTENGKAMLKLLQAQGQSSLICIFER